MTFCDICGIKGITFYTLNNLNFCPECYDKIAENQALESEKEYWGVEPLEE